MYIRYIKRLLDFSIALFALVLLSPILLITAILVKVKLGTPIVFKQNRPGLNEKIFTIYKFRTMNEKRNDQGELLPDNERLKGLGKWLRATSLDELPELVNVIKGDMSIVGPRPLLVQYLPIYDENQRKRHNVRPGITGLAQVNGRNLISWEDKFSLDVRYVNNVSLYLDFIIVLRTIKKVLSREGINQSDSITMESFTKSKEL